MMIAMVGGMFFAAPQIASADNPGGGGSNLEIIINRNKDLRVTEIIIIKNGIEVVREYLHADGTIVSITKDGVVVTPPPPTPEV